MKVKILGTKYTITKKRYSDDKDFAERNIDGYCNHTAKEIIYCDMSTHPEYGNVDKESINIIEKETLRHEITHAFFGESGLQYSSAQFTGGWATNEEMIDWIALQFPKMIKAFKRCDCL